MADNRIHFIRAGITNLIGSLSLCGVKWDRLVDDPKRVTCKDCQKILELAEAKE